MNNRHQAHSHQTQWMQKIFALYHSIDLMQVDEDTNSKLKEIEILLSDHHDEVGFENKIQIFKDYIHQSENPNPAFYRTEKIKLFLDAYYVKETKAFKHLNSILHQHYVRNEFNYSTISSVMLSAGKLINEGLKYSLAHPLESVLLLFALYHVTKVMAFPSAENLKRQCDGNDEHCQMQPGNQDQIPPHRPSHDFFTLPTQQPPTMFQPKKDMEPKKVSQIHGIDVIDISLSKKDCVKKEIGHSAGKICVIHGKKYYMKALDDEHQNAYLGAHNSKFLQRNVGVNTPDAMILSDAGHFYFATVAVPNFNSATTLRASKEEINSDQFRKNLVEKIGESGIAKFMVAVTFIDDLKPENWGYNENGLVIIDVDISPKELNDFFVSASKISNQDISVALTLDNIKEMKHIYTEMLMKPLPTLGDPTSNISNDTYIEILNIYIQSCEEIIEDSPHNASLFTDGSPSWRINEAFEKKIISLGTTIDNQASQSQVYRFAT